MFIQTQETPNPATIKFLPGREILGEGSADFTSEADAADAPLAARLFKVTGVKGVFLGGDFISVSKDDQTDWSMLKPMVMAVLMEHLSTGQPIINESARQSHKAGDDEDEISKQIRELIETRVRPAVMMDGGDIVFDRFEDGIVFLHMRGACSGCPSSTATLKVGIENMLKHYVPEVRDVRPIAD